MSGRSPAAHRTVTAGRRQVRGSCLPPPRADGDIVRLEARIRLRQGAHFRPASSDVSGEAPGARPCLSRARFRLTDVSPCRLATGGLPRPLDRAPATMGRRPQWWPEQGRVAERKRALQSGSWGGPATMSIFLERQGAVRPAGRRARVPWRTGRRVSRWPCVRVHVLGNGAMRRASGRLALLPWTLVVPIPPHPLRVDA